MIRNMTMTFLKTWRDDNNSCEKFKHINFLDMKN